MFVTARSKPATNPLNITYLTEYLRATTDDAQVIKKLAQRAVSAFTQYTRGHVIMPTEYSAFLDSNDVDYEIAVHNTPILSVEAVILSQSQSVANFESARGYSIQTTEETLEEDEYQWTAGDNTVFFERLLDCRPHRGIEIQYTAGYAEGTIPEDIILGLEQYVVYLFENRGDAESSVPDHIQSLWAPYVSYRLGY